MNPEGTPYTGIEGVMVEEGTPLHGALVPGKAVVPGKVGVLGGEDVLRAPPVQDDDGAGGCGRSGEPVGVIPPRYTGLAREVEPMEVELRVAEPGDVGLGEVELGEMEPGDGGLGMGRPMEAGLGGAIPPRYTGVGGRSLPGDPALFGVHGAAGGPAVAGPATAGNPRSAGGHGGEAGHGRGSE